MKLWNWSKKNPLAAVILAIPLLFVAYFILSVFLGLFSSPESLSLPRMTDNSGSSSRKNLQLETFNAQPGQASSNPAQSRMVAQEAEMSLLVKNVRETSTKITDYARSSGGYMVSSSLSNPGESATANVVVRVPSNKLQQALEYYRSLSLRVVSDTISAEDITDDYKDITARLDTLNKTKAKFESMLEKSTVSSDIIEVQTNIINLQDQIDNLKGEQLSMEQRAQMSKITVYLSTDELALPYAPNDSWDASVIFKNAVRSLIGTLRGIANMFIWILVYGVIWFPIVLFVLYKKKHKKLKPQVKE